MQPDVSGRPSIYILLFYLVTTTPFFFDCMYGICNRRVMSAMDKRGGREGGRERKDRQHDTDAVLCTPTRHRVKPVRART